MSRRLLLLAVLAGVTLVAGPAGAEPVTRPSQVDSSAKPAKRTATKSSASAKSSSKSKRSKASSAKTKRSKSKYTKAKSSKSKYAKSKYASKSKRKKAKRVAAAARMTRNGRKIRPAAETANELTVLPRGFAWPPSEEMETASRSCEADLDALGVAWQRATPEGMIVDPITLPRFELGGITYTSMYRKGPHRLDCQLARTLARIGPTLHALGVREVRFGSIYRNTNARAHGVQKRTLSRHALGLAMDIKAFVDANGRVIDVEKDYPKGDALLFAIEDTFNASQLFRTVLSPRNDPISHDDHFHIEAAVDFSTWQPLEPR